VPTRKRKRGNPIASKSFINDVGSDSDCSEDQYEVAVVSNANDDDASREQDEAATRNKSRRCPAIPKVSPCVNFASRVLPSLGPRRSERTEDIEEAEDCQMGEHLKGAAQSSDTVLNKASQRSSAYTMKEAIEFNMQVIECRNGYRKTENDNATTEELDMIIPFTKLTEE